MSLTSRVEVRAASLEGREGEGVREGVKERLGGWGEKENAVERRDVWERVLGGIERAERNGTCISHASFQVCSVAGTSQQQLSLSSQCKTFSLPSSSPVGPSHLTAHTHALTPLRADPSSARVEVSFIHNAESADRGDKRGGEGIRGRSGRSNGVVGELEIRGEGHQRFIHFIHSPPHQQPALSLHPSCNHFTPTFRNHVEDRQQKVWRSAPVPEISTLH